MLPAEEVATPFIKKEVEHSEDIYQGHLWLDRIWLEAKLFQIVRAIENLRVVL